MEKIFRKYNKIFFAGLTLFLIYPTFHKGYIFLLDWQVMPYITLADIDWSINSIGVIIYKLLAVILGFGFIQRIILFSIIFFSATAGFRLVKKTGNLYAQYFAGLFFIFNPFFYARLVEQPNIAGGSVLFFWFLVYFLEYLEEKKWKKLFLSALFAGLAVSICIHSVFFILLSIGLLLVFDYFKNKNWKLALKPVIVIFSLIILLNVNWLFSYTRGTEEGIGNIRNFSLLDVETYRTKGIKGDSVYYTVLAMQGYWGEYQKERIISIQDNRLWEFSFVCIFTLAIFGLIKIWKKNPFAKPLTILFLFSFVLAVGVSSPLFRSPILFLYEHAPLYIGLRESQKWVALIVFIYAFFAGWGIKYLLEWKLIKKYKKDIGIFCLILPMILSFSAIKGMHNHFKPGNFPKEWKEAITVLKNYDGKILFFPWHSYVNLDFAGKNIIIPAKPFFGKNLIVANNTEFGKLYSHYTDKQTLTIEKYTIKDEKYEEQKKEMEIDYENFSEDMKALEIGYVLLAKTEDWQEYRWLDIIDLEKVLENEKIIIYKIQ